MRYSISLLIIMISVIKLHSQRNLEIGLSYSVDFDHHKVEDPGNIVEGIYRWPDGNWELYFGLKLLNNVNLEVGVKRKKYSLGYIVNPEYNFTSIFYGALKTYQFPVRAIYSIPVFNKFEANPFIGYNLAYNLSGGSVITQTQYPGNDIMSNKIFVQEINFFSLFNLGIHFEYNIYKNHVIRINYAYNYGSKKLAKERSDYAIPDLGINNYAEIETWGSYSYIGLSYKYIINFEDD